MIEDQKSKVLRSKSKTKLLKLFILISNNKCMHKSIDQSINPTNIKINQSINLMNSKSINQSIS